MPKDNGLLGNTITKQYIQQHQHLGATGFIKQLREDKYMYVYEKTAHPLDKSITAGLQAISSAIGVSKTSKTIDF